MRTLAIVLGVLLLAIQYPLWLGKGGWMRVWDLDRQVSVQKDANSKLQVRNQALDAEVRDLKQGMDAIEERARYELGMIKQDEIFFQLLKDVQPSLPVAPVVMPPLSPPRSSSSAAPLQHPARP